MLTPAMLKMRFTESYEQIVAAVAPITQAESVSIPLPGINPMHWLVGHVVVARVNFLTLLGEPSIWPWETCRRFIPGSVPTADAVAVITWEALRLDFDRMQSLLVAALARTVPDELESLHDGRPFGDHLLEYAAHEAYHAGQIVVMGQVLKKDSVNG